MKASFQYFATTTYMDSLEVENTGDCCLEALDDLGTSYYLCVKTKLGITHILEYGPYMDGIAPNYLSYRYQEFEYSEGKIQKIINKFLNDGSRKITQVQEVNYEDVKKYFLDPKEFIDGLNY